MKMIYKFLPLLICFICGGGLLVLSFYIDNDYKNLLQNLASSFIVIPLLFSSYELAKSYSERKLKRELFDYAKVQVDTEILSIMHIFQKIFFSYNDETATLSRIERMLHVRKEALNKYLQENEFLGFQVYKSWEFPMVKIKDILENNYILSRLNDDQVLALIHLYQSLNSWHAFYSKLRGTEVFLATNKKALDYKVISAESCSEYNKQFPYRFILLKKLENDSGVVCDFGDFHNHDKNKLTSFHKINPDMSGLFASSISSVFNSICEWINITGKEFLLDPKEFRIATSTNAKKKFSEWWQIEFYKDG